MSIILVHSKKNLEFSEASSVRFLTSYITIRYLYLICSSMTIYLSNLFNLSINISKKKMMKNTPFFCWYLYILCFVQVYEINIFEL